jgi:hypothetical protein
VFPEFQFQWSARFWSLFSFSSRFNGFDRGVGQLNNRGRVPQSFCSSGCCSTVSDLPMFSQRHEGLTDYDSWYLVWIWVRGVWRGV